MRSHNAGGISFGTGPELLFARTGFFSASRMSAAVVVRFKASSDTKAAIGPVPIAPQRAGPRPFKPRANRGGSRNDDATGSAHPGGGVAPYMIEDRRFLAPLLRRGGREPAEPRSPSALHARQCFSLSAPRLAVSRLRQSVGFATCWVAASAQARQSGAQPKRPPQELFALYLAR